MKKLALALLWLVVASAADAAPLPRAVSAPDGIFAAFGTHPLVGIGEWHGLAQEMDFYSSLVRDPRFARQVGAIVVEMGGAAQQPVIDRYIDGENVPYAELRKVWSQTVGIFPTVQYLGTINLYATVRAVNARLPPDRRIRVWLGDPPVDWSKVRTKAAWLALEDQRDSFPAALIEREILAKHRKALIIYGADHFGVYPGGGYFSLLTPHRAPDLRERLDADYPGALFVVMPYVGYTNPACARAVERAFQGASAPALVFPVVGSVLETSVMRPGCVPTGATPDIAPNYQASIRTYTGLTSDALLYLGERGAMTVSPSVPDIYLDLNFRSEVDRRMRLRTGQGLNAAPDPSYNTAAPQPYWKD